MPNSIAQNMKLLHSSYLHAQRLLRLHSTEMKCLSNMANTLVCNAEYSLVRSNKSSFLPLRPWHSIGWNFIRRHFVVLVFAQSIAIAYGHEPKCSAEYPLVWLDENSVFLRPCYKWAIKTMALDRPKFHRSHFWLFWLFYWLSKTTMHSSGTQNTQRFGRDRVWTIFCFVLWHFKFDPQFQDHCSWANQSSRNRRGVHKGVRLVHIAAADCVCNGKATAREEKRHISKSEQMWLSGIKI